MTTQQKGVRIKVPITQSEHKTTNPIAILKNNQPTQLKLFGKENY